MVKQWGRGVGGHSGLQVGGALIGQLFWKNLSVGTVFLFILIRGVVEVR
jgi:hypothetical protein